MSNPTTAFGARPVRHLNGSPWNGQTVRCYIHASYATALFIGDFVTYQSELDYKDTSAQHPSIMAATAGAGNMIKGVIVSFEPRPASLETNYSPASTEGWANVCVAPDVIYEVRDDGSGTPSKLWPGQNAEIVLGSGGSTTTGLSSHALDATTPANTQNYQLHILGLSKFGNNELDDYAVWDVLLNTQENATGLRLGVTAT